jgi:Outer membrane protein beta-barrel domain
MAMRKAPWVIVIMIGVLAPWVGFSSSAAAVLVGVKGGATLANLTGEDVFNNSMSPGATGGAFARYRLSDMFSLQPEVLFAMKGAEYKVEDIESEQKIDCIDVPILVRLIWKNESKFEPSLLVGPVVGFLLDNEISDGEEIDLEDGSKSTDFGVVAGAGLDYKLGDDALLFDVRYERGLTSWLEDLDVKNSVVSITVGYGKKF